MGLVTESWVRLGDDVITLCCSCDVTRDAVVGGIESAVGGRGGGCEGTVAAGVLGVDAGAFSDDEEADAGGATAAAAAAAYRIGGSTTGAADRGGCCKPALRIVDMGCCAKVRFGGGLPERKKQSLCQRTIFQTSKQEKAYCLQIVLIF